MTIRPYEFLRHQLRQSVGISVEADKLHVFENRLASLAQARGAANVPALIESYVIHRDPSLWRDMVEAMTINETYFFRDRTPFTLFRDQMLPALIAARQAERRLRIWCAACSTGQEPYSLAMLLDEESRALKGWRIEIVASDLSETVLEAAREATYSQFEVQRGLPVSQLLRYFTRTGDRWQLNEHIRSRVTFRKMNLMADFKDVGLFDVIFCRNVLYYFDLPAKKDVLARLRRSIRDDGYLVMGAAETVLGVSTEWAPHAQHPALIVPSGRIDATPRMPLRLVSSL
jgi:chemotaxis protein methyltransferase CheR